MKELHLTTGLGDVMSIKLHTQIKLLYAQSYALTHELHARTPVDGISGEHKRW